MVCAYDARMKRQVIGLVLSALVLTGCESTDYRDSPEGKCLTGMGWHTGDGATWERDGHEAITLARIDDVVQPVTSQDLRDYVASGCR